MGGVLGRNDSASEEGEKLRAELYRGICRMMCVGDHIRYPISCPFCTNNDLGIQKVLGSIKR